MNENQKLKIKNHHGLIHWFGPLLALSLAAVSGCSPVDPAGGTEPPAVIQGQVSFGPLQPVEIEGEPTPETPPELFEGRQILVFGPDGETLVTEAPVQSDGTYRVELEPGDYVIGFTLVGIETSESVPAAVSLSAGQVLELDISVDTGIR